MKKGRGILGILMFSGLLLCWGTKVYASMDWAKLTAVLTANETSITVVADEMFEATLLFGQTSNNSEYSIEFVAKGGNSSNSITYTEASFIVSPGNSLTQKIDSLRNYHSLILTGRDGLKEVKGCIGNGYVEGD